MHNQGLYQLFLMDPIGVKVAFDFANAEAKRIKAEVMASALRG